MPTTNFRVVTDSTADLPPAWRERYGIEVVPLSVLFGNQALKDGVDLSDDDFFQRLAGATRLPTTAAPAPGDFAAVYQRLSRECDGCLSVHIGSNLSGTVEAARVGAATLPDFPVRVIDSRSVSMTVAFLCQIAAEQASLEDAVKAVEQRIPKQHILALLDTLKYVEMGGRVGRIQYIVGSMLDVKAIMSVAGGEIRPVDRVRTRTRAIPRLKEMLREAAPLERLAIMHSQAEADAARLRDEVRADFPELDIAVAQIGAVLGAHVGPRALGACYLSA